MRKINEKQLRKVLKKRNNKSITVEIKGIISVLTNMENVQASYTRKNGIIELQENNTNVTITIETELLY